MILKGLLMLIPTLTLAACAAPSLDEVAQPTPKFEIRSYFDGPLKAYGVVRDRGGKVKRSFVMDMKGIWEGNSGRLEEHLVFNDGEIMDRTWKLEPVGPGRYTATAEDVVGEGTFREQGNTLRLDYVLRIPYKDGTLDVTVIDWLFLQPDGVVVNQSVLKKFGFRVGDILTTMIKPPPDDG